MVMTDASRKRSDPAEQLAALQQHMNAREWAAANHAAIQAHNERIAREGTLLKPIWLAA